MNKFKVSDNFFNTIPNAYFGIVIIKNFDNKKDYPLIEKMLKEDVNECQKKYEGAKVKELKEIIPYREAFTKLNINPNKYMCSIEALVNRIAKGHDLPTINPAVDLGNALSVKHLLPVGVHDIDKFTDALEIREATNNDTFIPFNSTEIENPDDKEWVYASGTEIKTRKWTWRQGENSKITKNATNLFIIIDGFSDINKTEIENLKNELMEFLKPLNLDIQESFVDINHKEYEWE